MTRPGPRTALGAALVAVTLLAAGCSPDRSSSQDPGTSRSGSPVAARPVESRPAWQPRNTLHVARDDFATAVVDDRIWVLGGMTGDRGNRLDSIEVYDPRSDRWQQRDETLPESLASFEATAVGDRIFVFGGLDSDSRPSGAAAVLDTSSGSWRRLPALPHPRYAHTVTLHDGLVHVIGGEGVDGPEDAVDVFDPASGTWSAGTPMPRARGSHDTVSVGEQLFVLGGWLGSAPTDLVQTYDPATGRWGIGPPLPEPVSRGGAAMLDGRLWVSFHRFSSVLDVEQGVWSPANPLTVSRHGLGYVAVGGSIYGIGGCTETPLRDVRTVDVLRVT